ncbi:hypothetical protein T310_2851 [Rasamsonia emersonii CBS 393.64]|uniref:Uncharacterized protein n=1 Tax=Rasamsonia emersonii (strain ATCC 16479 / CBS 393.64 / IMI 116815) TaxID=1408163 RepID=A0A0F4YYG4_RASE3|nr:hypothetical protein T310_2851 [Rasamsonia emersonii CBS 393.64]KKA23125.1 hypothetical protein T310_2851 [Rasamsonia emersonii CBS 393.64]
MDENEFKPVEQQAVTPPPETLRPLIIKAIRKKPEIGALWLARDKDCALKAGPLRGGMQEHVASRQKRKGLAKILEWKLLRTPPPRNGTPPPRNGTQSPRNGTPPPSSGTQREL